MRKRILLTSILFIAAALCAAGAKKTTVTVKAVFSDGEKAFWPFSEARASSTVKKPTAPGEEMTYTLRDGGHVFRIKGKNGITINSKAGMRVGTAAGDYIDLPVLPGMAVTKVSIVIGLNGNQGAPFIEADGAMPKGGEVRDQNFSHGDILEWTPVGIAPGKPCRIAISKGGNFGIRQIEISYTGVPPKAKKVKAPKSKYKTVEVCFYDEETGKSAWPFTSKRLSYNANVTEADLVTENLDEFTVKCSDKVYLASTGNLYFGNLKYSYLMLPSFGTKALVKVALTTGKPGSNGAPAIMRQNTWKVVEGGAAVNSFENGKEHVWELSGTEPGERYRIVLTRDAGITIKKLTLYYDK
ncbi:MAG: hypothetical protein IJ799_04835 [Bacteroidales bacterium]|nr:hypothetical protein [Bacteroidales bacterium]